MKAADVAAEARELVSRLADDKLVAHVAETQAEIALAQDGEAATTLYVDEALTLARATDNPTAESSALLTLARLHKANGRLVDAESTYRQAIDLLRIHGPRPRRSEALRELADLLSFMSRDREAVAMLREALGSGATQD